MRVLPQSERDFPSFLKDLLAAIVVAAFVPLAATAFSSCALGFFFLLEPCLNNLLKVLKRPWVRKRRKLDIERYVQFQDCFRGLRKDPPSICQDLFLIWNLEVLVGQ